MYFDRSVRILLCLAVCVGPAVSATAGEIHQTIAANDLTSAKALIRLDPGLLSAVDEQGRTPLNLAVERNFAEIAQFLIQQGADINPPDAANCSPLHYAASNGNVNLARLLLTNGATAINDTSRTEQEGLVGGWTPLHMACIHGHLEVAQLLLDSGADLEARDGARRTPLILAADGGNVRLAEFLIDRGADINAEAIRGYTALLYGVRGRSEEYVNLLIGKKARISPDALPRAFQSAVVAGMEELYDYVLALGFDLDGFRNQDPGLVFPAAAGGSLAIVRSLVEHGYDPVQEDADGNTTIHAAAAEGRDSVIGYLAELGLDLNLRNRKGESAFNLAQIKGHTGTAERLAALGADVGAPRFPTFEGPFMGQQPPGDTPQIFLPGIVSGHDRAHSSITFSPDGLEAYWTEMVPPEGRVAFTHVEDGKWTYPVTAAVDRDPTFSPDGNRLYFIRTRPFREGETPGGDPDVKEEYWYLERTDTGWSAPISAGDKINALGVHWPCSVDRHGNLYFSEFADNMYCSPFVDGSYASPVRLTEFFGNPTLMGSSPFIAPDGGYLLFTAADSLHISFKRGDGTWTDRINLGGVINASRVNGSPRITADGKYMFFVSAGQGRPWGIYWVSAGFIDRLRSELLTDSPK